MKTLNLSVNPRTSTGRNTASSLRREGKVPGVLYGGSEVVHFEAEEKSFKPLIYTPDIHLVKLDLGGKQTDAILKDIQYHPVTDQIMHIDMLEVSADKPVEMSVPVQFIGTAAGVREGGQMLKKLTRINVKGLISKIPGTIDINVEGLGIGDYVRIENLKIDGITFMHEPAVTVVAVKETRAVVEETPVAAAAAPAEGAAAEGAAPAEGAKAEEKKEEKK